MIHRCVLIFRTLALAVLVAPVVRAGDERPATQPAGGAARPLAILDRLVGSWVGEHRGSGNGSNFGVRVVYEPGIERHLLKARSYSLHGDAEPTFRYETFIFYHPGERRVKSFSISREGGVFDGTISGTRDELNWQFTALSGQTRTEYKQTIRFLSDDRYQWNVWRNSPEGWKQVIEGTFKREAEAEKSAMSNASGK